MKVFTYSSGSEELLPNERAIARIKIPATTGFGEKRRKGEEWHPVILYAATQEEARAKAVAWWDGEVARERNKVELAARRGEAMRARAAAAKASADGTGRVPSPPQTASQAPGMQNK